MSSKAKQAWRSSVSERRAEPREVECAACGGSGVFLIRPTQPIPCPECGGTGKVRVPRSEEVKDEG